MVPGWFLRRASLVSPQTPTNILELGTSRMAYHQTGPSYTFCGIFSGSTNMFAARWLRRLEHELNVYRVGDELIPSEKGYGIRTEET